MNAEAQLEEAVCLAALHITEPVSRAQFLDRACAGDAQLRATVEEMLRANDAAENFFDQCRSAVDVPRLDAQAAVALRAANGEIDFRDEQLGSLVGRYQLLQKIGEGGCGVVYLAEQQEPVRRHVALKVIKLGMDTKSVIARFEAERQALALMDHPNIATLSGAAARAPNKQASDVRQPHAAAKVRTPPRQANNVTIEASFFRLAAWLAPASQQGWQRRGNTVSNRVVTTRGSIRSNTVGNRVSTDG